MVYTWNTIHKFLLPWGFDDDSLPLMIEIYLTKNVIINVEKIKFSYKNKNIFLNPILSFVTSTVIYHIYTQ